MSAINYLIIAMPQAAWDTPETRAGFGAIVSEIIYAGRFTPEQCIASVNAGGYWTEAEPREDWIVFADSDKNILGDLIDNAAYLQRIIDEATAAMTDPRVKWDIQANINAWLERECGVVPKPSPDPF
jgi:hypothetical protein